MITKLAKLILHTLGWNSNVRFNDEIKQCIIIVGPHTSNWDMFYGVLYRITTGLKGAKFLGKAELFKPPFGFLFKKLGGIPVFRNSKNDMVNQVVDMFKKNKHLKIAMSPEGTRKKVNELKTGFYYISIGASVPIVMCAIDYKLKTIIFSKLLFPSGKKEQDYKTIISFFSSVNGKNPSKGLAHLAI